MASSKTASKENWVESRGSGRAFEKMAQAMQRYASEQIGRSGEATKSSNNTKATNREYNSGRGIASRAKQKASISKQLLLVSPDRSESRVAMESDEEHESQFDRKLLTIFESEGSVAERFRRLRDELLLRWFSKGQKTLAILSSERYDGRSFLASNLAVVFAQMGKRTLLIDADLRYPKQHRIFNIGDREAGLGTLLTGQVTGCIPHQVTLLTTLYILPAIPCPTHVQELMNRPIFSQLLDEAAEFFDVVLVDTSAANMYADAEQVAVRTKGALLLARNNQTRAKYLDDLVERLRGKNVEVVGSILD